MTDSITLPEIQEFLAYFWSHYDSGQLDVLAPHIADDVTYVSRSESGHCPFENLLAADLHGATETLTWLKEHRDESPYPLRHHITNIFRTGVSGDVINVRFYLYVNQITNNVPFDVSSGVADVGIRRAGDKLEFTSITVVLDAEDSIPLAEHRAKLAAADS